MSDSVLAGAAARDYDAIVARVELVERFHPHAPNRYVFKPVANEYICGVCAAALNSSEVPGSMPQPPSDQWVYRRHIIELLKVQSDDLTAYRIWPIDNPDTTYRINCYGFYEAQDFIDRIIAEQERHAASTSTSPSP